MSLFKLVVPALLRSTDSLYADVNYWEDEVDDRVVYMESLIALHYKFTKEI